MRAPRFALPVHPRLLSALRGRALARAALGLVCAASVAAPAWSQSANYVFRYSSHSPWPTGLDVPDHVTRAVSGDFDGDSRRDAVLLADHVPVFVYGAAYYGTMRYVGVTSSTCNDFDTGIGLASEGRDALVTVESLGLVAYSWDWLTGEFIEDWHDSASAWQNAKLVRVGDLNGDGTHDFVGVESDGSTVVIKRSTSATTWSQTTVSTAGGATDLVLLNFDSDSPWEIAVLDSAGVQVIDHNDAVQFTFARNSGVTNQMDAIEPVKCNGASTTKLAWVRNRASPNQAKQELVVLQRASPQVNYQYDIDLLSSVFAVAGADSPGLFSPDGDTDLVLANKDLYLPLVSQNSSPTSLFGSLIPYDEVFVAPALNLEEVFNVPDEEDPEPLAMNNEMKPLYTDFNKDGKPDLLIYVPERGAMYLFESEPLGVEALLGQELIYAFGLRQEQVLVGSSFVYRTWLQVAVRRWVPALTIESGPPTSDYEYFFNFNHYKQAGPYAQNSNVTARASYSLPIYSTDQTPSETTIDPIPSESGDEIDVACLEILLQESDSSDVCFSDIHWIEFSWVAAYVAGGPPHPVTQGADYFLYISEDEFDALTLWTQCYSWVPDTSLRDTSYNVIDIEDGTYACDPEHDYVYVNGQSCQSGSTPPVMLPSVGTRRKLRFPPGNGGNILPTPPAGNTADCRWASNEFPWF